MSLLDTQIKRKFASIITKLLATDIAIFLDIPVLRQVLGAFCFTIIPGLLLLHILKLNRTSLVKRFVLSIGLSISFLIFAGLLVNAVYPFFGIFKPLSTTPLITSYNAILIVLCIIGYKRNKEDFEIIPHNGIKIKDNHLISPLIFSFIFPLLSILGTHLMNVNGNNIALLIMIFLIPAYAALIVYLHEKIPADTYPVAIWMISIALLLILRARGFIIGGDFGENLHLTAANMYWDVRYHDGLNACLGIGFLNTIYSSILGIRVLEVYRFLVPSLFSITPVTLFFLFRRYIGNSYAFLGALFFMSQFNFIYCGIGGVRSYMGLFFFALAMMIHFDNELTKLNKRALFLIFMFSLILSYYSYSYMFFILIFLSWAILSIFGALTGTERFKKEHFLSSATVALAGAWIFAWWSQITETHFSTGVNFIYNSFKSMTEIFVIEAQSELAQKSFGVGLEGEAEILNLVFYYIALILIALGSIELIRRYRDSKFGVEYTSMIFVCLGIWAIAVSAPFVTENFGMEGIYFFTLVLLCPSLIIGAETVCQLPSSIKSRLACRLKNSNSSGAPPNIRGTYIGALVVITVIILQLMVNTGITYQMFDNPRSIILNSEGHQYNIWYVHPQELATAEWVMKNRDKDLKIYGDAYFHHRFAKIEKGKPIKIDNRLFMAGKPIDKGYIFLRYQNVVKGEVTPWYARKIKGDNMPITNYSHLFIGKSKIYNNGGSEIWK